jgi:hypothetical protein
MTVPTPAPPAEPTPPPAAQPPEPTPPVEDTTDWKAESRKWEQRNKDNSAAVKALEKQQRDSMPEAEKATAEAKAAGRAEAVTEFGKRLARTEFDALAGRRNPDFDTASALEWVDLARFVGEDGEPDSKAIKAAVERLVPAPEGGPPSFDGGPRTTAPVSTGMNGLIRKAAGRA